MFEQQLKPWAASAAGPSKLHYTVLTKVCGEKKYTLWSQNMTYINK